MAGRFMMRGSTVTKREREAWAKAVVDEPQNGHVVRVSRNPATVVHHGRVPNKANTYKVRVDPSLWKQIEFLVRAWMKAHPKKRPWWVGPSQEVIDFEEQLAWWFRAQERRTFSIEEDVEMELHLFGQDIDVDGVKAVLDGVEKSGRISNDRQVTKLTIEKMPADHPRMEILLKRR